MYQYVLHIGLVQRNESEDQGCEKKDLNLDGGLVKDVYKALGEC